MWLGEILKSTLTLCFCSNGCEGKEVVQASAILAKVRLLVNSKLLLAEGWHMLQFIGPQATAKG